MLVYDYNKDLIEDVDELPKYRNGSFLFCLAPNGSLSIASITVFLANGHHATPASNSDPQTRRIFSAEAVISPGFAKRTPRAHRTLP